MRSVAAPPAVKVVPMKTPSCGALVSGRWPWLLAVPLAGYLPAWLGHFFFEGNSPATFSYPLYSLRGDFAMLADVLSGRMRW